MNTYATVYCSPEMLQYPCKTLHSVNYESENNYAKSPPARIYIHVVRQRLKSIMH